MIFTDQSTVTFAYAQGSILEGLNYIWGLIAESHDFNGTKAREHLTEKEMRHDSHGLLNGSKFYTGTHCMWFKSHSQQTGSIRTQSLLKAPFADIVNIP